MRAYLSSRTQKVGTKVNCHGGQRESEVLQGFDQFLEDDKVFYFEENISAVYLTRNHIPILANYAEHIVPRSTKGGYYSPSRKHPWFLLSSPASAILNTLQ